MRYITFVKRFNFRQIFVTSWGYPALPGTIYKGKQAYYSGLGCFVDEQRSKLIEGKGSNVGYP